MHSEAQPIIDWVRAGQKYFRFKSVHLVNRAGPIRAESDFSIKAEAQPKAGRAGSVLGPAQPMSTLVLPIMEDWNETEGSTQHGTNG